jgi:AcrR family transcriptional regulator
MSGEERRAFILAQAKKVFASHSYAEASTGELARASDVTEPMLYKHFGSKKGLFIAVLNEFGELFMQRLQERVDRRVEKDLLEALVHIIPDYRATIQADPDIHKVFFQALAEVGDAQIAQEVGKHNHRIYQLIQNLFKRAKQEGLLNQDVDVDVATWGYLCVILAMQYNVMQQMSETLSNDILQEISRLWLRAVHSE